MAAKTISILGSTGSIGTQSLEVIDKSKLEFTINSLTANNNIKLLSQQIDKYKPKRAVICNLEKYNEFTSTYSGSTEILYGDTGLENVVDDTDNNLIISSLVGFSGVIPTLKAINNNINVALANKETLVAAGHIITKAAKDKNVSIFAIDSEHSAIQQCIIGEKKEQIEKIILTASGGPFFELPKSSFDKITVQDALNHPNWEMGSKITIDSASMMNKGLEVIEAFWLFDLSPEQIDVVIHPQSIIHSMVQFRDGSVKAQLGLPDMKIPIAYAIDFPNHNDYPFERMDLAKIGSLTFFEPDTEKFRNLRLAFDSLNKGGNIPAALNAANEITVQAFLDEAITFNQISEYNEFAINQINKIDDPSLEQIIETDNLARDIVKRKIS